MPSKITLQFNFIPISNASIALRVDPTSHNDLIETFRGVRTGPYIVSTDVANLEQLRDNYFNAFSVDHNALNTFELTKSNAGGIFLDIEHPTDGYFEDAKVLDLTSGDVSFVIVNTPDAETIEVTDFEFLQAPNPCENALVEITTDVLAVSYTLDGGTPIPNSSNPFTYEQVRGTLQLLQVENSTGSTFDYYVTTPDKLLAGNVSTSILNSPSGATVTVNVVVGSPLGLEYSLDNSTWQSSNVFNGVLEGNYTVYVREALGCNVTHDFYVPSYSEGGVGVDSPYADLPSKSNSIRFARDITWGNCSNYKNDENTLGCQLPYIQNPREVNQLFQTCDVITTQIKSNYENITATAIRENGTSVNLPVEPKTNNLGVKAKADAIRYSVNGRMGVYFTSGNTYDFDTDEINGSYNLNGSLPSWGVVGGYVIIEGIWYEITGLFFDETKYAEVLILDADYTGSEQGIIIGSIYNLQPYNVHEFVINLASFENESIQISINQTDSRTGFENIRFISEVLEIVENHFSTVCIEYYSDVNTDIYYASGIKNKIRIPIEYIEGGIEDDTESEKTDTSVYLVNAEVYETDTFHFQLITKQLMRKLILALAHKTVIINGVEYVKGATPEATNVVGTNLYRVSALMVKAGDPYSTKDTNSGSAGVIEVVDLIEVANGGFVKSKN